MTKITITNETSVDTGILIFSVKIETSLAPKVYAPLGDGRIPKIPEEGYKPIQKSTFVTYVKGSIYGPSYLIGLQGLGGVPLASYGQAVVEPGDLIIRELFATP